MISATGKFLRHVVPGIVKPLRVLWNEIIGFVFLCLAGLAGIKLYSYVQQENLVAIGFTVVWVLVMGYFGVSSFLRARKISRS